MREICTSGSEGGGGVSRSLPLSMTLLKTEDEGVDDPTILKRLRFSHGRLRSLAAGNEFAFYSSTGMSCGSSQTLT
jgi:hypothetical protein